MGHMAPDPAPPRTVRGCPWHNGGTARDGSHSYKIRSRDASHTLAPPSRRTPQAQGCWTVMWTSSALCHTPLIDHRWLPRSLAALVIYAFATGRWGVVQQGAAALQVMGRPGGLMGMPAFNTALSLEREL